MDARSADAYAAQATALSLGHFAHELKPAIGFFLNVDLLRCRIGETALLSRQNRTKPEYRALCSIAISTTVHILDLVLKTTLGDHDPSLTLHDPKKYRPNRQTRRERARSYEDARTLFIRQLLAAHEYSQADVKQRLQSLVADHTLYGPDLDIDKTTDPRKTLERATSAASLSLPPDYATRFESLVRIRNAIVHLADFGLAPISWTGDMA